MSKSSKPAAPERGEGRLQGSDIVLPEAPEFASRPRTMRLEDAVVLIETLLETVNSRPGELERRQRDRVTTPFEL